MAPSKTPPPPVRPRRRCPSARTVRAPCECCRAPRLRCRCAWRIAARASSESPRRFTSHCSCDQVGRFAGKPFRFVNRADACQNLCPDIAPRECRVEIVASRRLARDSEPGLGLVVPALFGDRVCELCSSSRQDLALSMSLQRHAARSERLFWRGPGEPASSSTAPRSRR